MALPKLKYDSYPDAQGITVVKKQIEWVSTLEAAAIMNVTDETVRRLCRDKAIRCRKWVRSWQVDRASAEAYVKSVGGRPPKKDES
jgi:DNA-directed RNA polymerase specialized sigma24 family protein